MVRHDAGHEETALARQQALSFYLALFAAPKNHADDSSWYIGCYLGQTRQTVAVLTVKRSHGSYDMGVESTAHINLAAGRSVYSMIVFTVESGKRT